MTDRSTRGASHAVLVIALAALLAGCQPDQDVEQGRQGGPQPQKAEPSPASVPEQAQDTTAALPESAEPEAAVAARANLASRLGIPPEDVTLFEVRSVYWRSSALGCPDPEMSYAQVLTKGWLIRLTVDGTEYRYHAGEDGEPFTCHPRRAEPPIDFAVK